MKGTLRLPEKICKIEHGHFVNNRMTAKIYCLVMVVSQDLPSNKLFLVIIYGIVMCIILLL